MGDSSYNTRMNNPLDGGCPVTVAEAVATIRRLSPAERARAVQEIMEEYFEDGEDTDSEAEQRHLTGS